jgi:hypothetical protein
VKAIDGNNLRPSVTNLNVKPWDGRTELLAMVVTGRADMDSEELGSWMIEPQPMREKWQEGVKPGKVEVGWMNKYAGVKEQVWKWNSGEMPEERTYWVSSPWLNEMERMNVRPRRECNGRKLEKSSRKKGLMSSRLLRYGEGWSFS